MACNFQMKSCTASKDDGQLSKLVGNSNYMFCRALFRRGGRGRQRGWGGLVVLGGRVPVERFLGAGLCATEVGVKCVSG